MASHYSTLAWKISWVEEPGRMQSMESQRVGHDWATSLSLFTFMHWRRKWQPIPVFLPGESQGQGSLVGCRLWGCTESDTTEATLQQQNWLRIFLQCRIPVFNPWVGKIPLRRKWQPTPVFFPGKFHGERSLAPDYIPWGHKELDITEWLNKKYPLSWWCHPTISSSVIPFFSCLWSFPASKSFLVSQLFTSGGQSTGASASASDFPINIQGWYPLGLTSLSSVLSKGLSRVFSSTTAWRHQFMVLSAFYCPALTSIHDYWENHSFD